MVLLTLAAYISTTVQPRPKALQNANGKSYLVS